MENIPKKMIKANPNKSSTKEENTESRLIIPIKPRDSQNSNKQRKREYFDRKLDENLLKKIKKISNSKERLVSLLSEIKEPLDEFGDKLNSRQWERVMYWFNVLNLELLWNKPHNVKAPEYIKIIKQNPNYEYSLGDIYFLRNRFKLLRFIRQRLRNYEAWIGTYTSEETSPEPIVSVECYRKSNFVKKSDFKESQKILDDKINADYKDTKKDKPSLKDIIVDID